MYMYIVEYEMLNYGTKLWDDINVFVAFKIHDGLNLYKEFIYFTFLHKHASSKQTFSYF